MYIVILVLVLLNFITSTGWLDLLNKIFKPTYDLLNFIIPLTVITSFLIVLVPIKFPSITVTWVVGCFFYIFIGAILACIPDKE
jgi:hypothetical protein